MTNLTLSPDVRTPGPRAAAALCDFCEHEALHRQFGHRLCLLCATTFARRKAVRDFTVEEVASSLRRDFPEFSTFVEKLAQNTAGYDSDVSYRISFVPGLEGDDATTFIGERGESLKSVVRQIMAYAEREVAA